MYLYQVHEHLQFIELTIIPTSGSLFRFDEKFKMMINVNQIVTINNFNHKNTLLTRINLKDNESKFAEEPLDDILDLLCE